jgi:drug/metabolite transporter (DMT)-like permease
VLAGAGVISWVPAPRVDWIGGTLALALAFIAGNFALQYGAARLPATVTAVVLLTEVVFASVSAAWLGHETLGARTLAGGTLIVASALLAAVRPERRRAA